MDLQLVTAPGLEGVAAAEVGGRAAPGGVRLEGELEDLLIVQLRSRAGTRLLWRLASGKPSDLARLASAVDWPAIVRGPFHVEVTGGGRHPRQLEAPVAAAIRASVKGAAPAAEGAPILVRLAGGELSILADATGDPLHRRGYRLETAMAPLREDLAARILRLAGWDGATPLVDPMCGAGTFPIEGALIATGRSPVIDRAFACESWPAWPAELSDRVRRRFRAEAHAPAAAIVAADVHAGALGVTRRNAARAGVLEHLQLQRSDAAELVPPEGPPGLLVANLPYGRRVGEERELGALYERVGAGLRARFGGWTIALLVADTKLARRLRLAPTRQIELRSGGLPVTLLVRDRA